MLDCCKDLQMVKLTNSRQPTKIKIKFQAATAQATDTASVQCSDKNSVKATNTSGFYLDSTDVDLLHNKL